MAKIAVVDDDLAMELLVDSLKYRGHKAFRVQSAAEAIARIEEICSSDLCILDVIMAWPENASASTTSSARSAGMKVFRQIRDIKPELPILAYSATQDADLVQVLVDDPYTTFMSKWSTPTLKEFVTTVHQQLGLQVGPVKPTAFIIHGQNDRLKLEVKNYLQNVLNLPEPIILHEQPDQGRTIMEKFEEYAARSPLVFVLLTPDDVGARADNAPDLKRRTRQNVIFEMGYFLGRLGRGSGRVILLHIGPLELPSDLSGVLYIDVSNGVEPAGERIRREVEHVQ